MRLKVFEPKSELLKRYIDCYYFLHHSASEDKTSYISFPNVKTGVSLISKAEVEIKGNSIKINGSNTESEKNLFVGNFSQPVFVQYSGQVREISIIFKPLGINAFLEESFDQYSHETCDYFNPYKEYASNMRNILALENEVLQIEALEEYWLSKLKNFEHPFLSQVIDEISKNIDIEIPLSELAKKHKISSKTLIKHFRQHIGKTPSEFKANLKLQQAISAKKAHQVSAKLSDIAYAVNFFDQSHMIKHFKTLTGLTPKEFFKKITSLENGKINWQFL